MQRLKNEQGMAFIVEIIIGAVALAAIGVAVYMATKPKTGGSSLIPARATLSTKCEYNDDELCRFINNWKAQESYTVKSTQAGNTSQTVMQFSGDKKFHMTTSVDGKANWEVISLDNVTYTKDFTDNKWWKQTTDPSKDTDNPAEDFDFGKDDSKDQPEAQRTQFKAMGKEACGQFQCFKYQVIEPGDGSTSYIFFDNRDYLLRKMTIQSQDGAYSTEFSYDKVNISAPSPTKEVAPGQVIVPGGTTYTLPVGSMEE